MLQRHTQRRLLIDCNSFFASCEIMRHPALRGKPVCVGKDIVLAASYEAKFFGVYTGLPVWEAKKLLPPEAVYCDMDMQWYVTVSKRLVAFLQERFCEVIPASIDESFIRCDDWLVHSDAQIEADILTLQQDILQHIGLPVSIGIAPTKLLAKISADYKKPLGYTISIHDYQIEELLADFPIANVPFIGSETTEKLAPYVKTALGYTNLSHAQVKTLLGQYGVKIWYELNAISVNITQLKRHTPGGIGRTRSFNPNFTADRQRLWHHLQDNITRARKELYAKDLGTSVVSVFLKSKGFKRRKIKKTLPYCTNDFSILTSVAHELFNDLIDHEEIQSEEMRSTGVSFRSLGSIKTLQLGLFGYEKEKSKVALNKTVFSLKKRFGKSGVHIGTHALYTKKKNSSLDFFSTVGG